MRQTWLLAFYCALKGNLDANKSAQELYLGPNYATRITDNSQVTINQQAQTEGYQALWSSKGHFVVLISLKLVYVSATSESHFCARFDVFYETMLLPLD